MKNIFVDIIRINVYAKSLIHTILYHVNLPPPEQNGRHFTDGLFKWIFMNEKFCILNQISPKFPPKGSIDNKSILVQIIAWCQTGDKPLPEPILTQFLNAYIRLLREMSERRHASMNVAGRLSLCYATLHWHDSRALNAGFPRGTFL